MKVWIYLEDEQGESHRICWYVGTSDAAIESAVRMQLRLSDGIRFLLRDPEGDLVPISSTLPHDHYYILVTEEHIPTQSTTLTTPLLTANALKRMAESVTAAAESTESSVTAIQRIKRKRLTAPATPVEGSTIDGTSVDAHTNTNGTIAVVTPKPPPLLRPPTRTRSIATIVTQFLQTFTRPILHDDNVSFIPNTGKYALYALYCEIVPDFTHHPKGQDAFYKMTSMQGKVDRQRVIRYYQDLLTASGQIEYVQYKPQGKGPFLRKYLLVETDAQLKEIVKAASFVTMLDLVPEEVVSRYLNFVKGFHPISKCVYQAHHNGDEVNGFLDQSHPSTTPESMQ